jgi:hypothetical protein
MDKRSIYIIVLNWNGIADTLSCLESLLRLTFESALTPRIVVCDNASSDDSIARMRRWASGEDPAPAVTGALAELVEPPITKPLNLREYVRADGERGGERNAQPDVTLIHTGDNLGYAGGNNVGIRYALARGDADYIWVLNNDTVVDPDALSMLVDRARVDREIAMVGSTLRYFDQPDLIQALGGCTFNPWRVRARPIGEGSAFRALADAETAEIEARTAYVVGASILVSVSFIEDVGLFEEDYFLYFEELDWAERARRSKTRKWKLAFAPGSVVYHKVGASAGTQERSAFSLRMLYGNQLRFMRRFFPALVPLARFSMLVEGCKALAKLKTGEAKVFFSMLFASSVAKVRR